MSITHTCAYLRARANIRNVHCANNNISPEFESSAVARKNTPIFKFT